jgi:AhpD family alkylhydroperoxidase
MNKPLTEIDPAYSRLAEFAKATGGTTGTIQKLREQAIYRDGAFPAKHKALMAMLWSICTKCEPCVKYYALKSHELGATIEEVGEVCAVASAMGGCVGETWALKAFAAYSGDAEGAEECCTV